MGQCGSNAILQLSTTPNPAATVKQQHKSNNKEEDTKTETFITNSSEVSATITDASNVIDEGFQLLSWNQISLPSNNPRKVILGMGSFGTVVKCYLSRGGAQVQSNSPLGRPSDGSLGNSGGGENKKSIVATKIFVKAKGESYADFKVSYFYLHPFNQLLC